MIKIKAKKWDVIEIDWFDSCHMSGWTKDDLVYEITDLQHKTTGYFLHETKYSVSVVQSRKSTVKEKGTSIDALMEIPKVAITKIKILK